MAFNVGFKPILPEHATKIISLSLLSAISSKLDKVVMPSIKIGFAA